MDKRPRVDYKTEFSNVVHMVKNILNPCLSDREFIDRIVSFLTQYYSLSDINPNLKGYGTLTETQGHYLRVIFLRVILDLETLRNLCLFAPKDIQFERWRCVFGPCNSAEQLRSCNQDVIQSIRARLGIRDELPPGYFDQYQAVWGGLSRSKQLRSVPALAPLILFPIKYFSEETKADIRRQCSFLDNIPVDGLFVCCDHFGPFKLNGRPVRLPLPLRSSAIFNYSLSYLRDMVDKGQVSLRVNRTGAWSSHHVNILVDATLRGPNDVQLGQVVFPTPGIEDRLSQVSQQTGLTPQAAKTPNRLFSSEDLSLLNEWYR
jgi:hypothetical protein